MLRRDSSRSTFTTVRPAEGRDVARLLVLLLGAAAAEVEEAPRHAALRGLELLVGDRHAPVLVAERGGVIMGMATVQGLVVARAGGLAGVVDNLVLDPEAWRHGVQEDLLDGVVRQAKKRRFKALHVLVGHREDAALAGYRAAGWVPDGRMALVRDLD